MKKILSLVLVAAMLFSMVAAIPLNISAASTDDKKSTEVEAYYFGGKVQFKELYGNAGKASNLKYLREESIKKGGDSANGTLVIDGVIDEGEWGAPVVVVDSKYAATNGGLKDKTNGEFETPSAENTYFYYLKNNYTDPSASPVEKGMAYSLYFMWDEEYLYIAVDTNDITGHISPLGDNSIWNADTFQFRVDKDGPNTRENGYNPYVVDEKGNRVKSMPWRSSVYKGFGEFTSEVPNFVVSYSGAGTGGMYGTIVRDNANRYYEHVVAVENPDDPEGEDILETQYVDTELSYYAYASEADEEGYNEYPYCATYEEYVANELKGKSPELVERGPVYATVKPVKTKGTNFTTQYEIAVPWAYIDDSADFKAEADDKFGIATMLLDRQNTNQVSSFGAFLEWGSGINGDRHDYDYATCNGSNSLTLSATEYNKRDTHEHNFAEATCEAPETCTICGYQRGYNAGHDYELVDYKLPTTSEAGYANSKCNDCDTVFNRELAAASDEVIKSFNRNDGNVNLDTKLNGSFGTPWTQIKWTETANGWESEAGSVVYRIDTDGNVLSEGKNMLWLKGEKRPEISSADHVEATEMVNPYDCDVLDFSCYSETKSYFMIEDFGAKNSTVSMKVDLWNRLEGKDREMEADSGYHDTLAFWFTPTKDGPKYMAGLFIVDDKDADGNVTNTKYYFAITPNNSSELTIEEFETTALAYKEIDPAILEMGQGDFTDMTFFVDYDANIALLFWDGELAIGEYDPHFVATGTSDPDVDPILRVMNIELCITDFYAGRAGLAADFVNIEGSAGGEGTDSSEPESSDSESDTESSEPESSDSESDTESSEPESSDTESNTESSEPESSDSEPVEPEEPVLGSYENPYLLNISTGFPVMPMGVTVEPGETAFVKASDINNSVVSVGYATSADYMIGYLRFTYMPEGEDNTASFSMIPEAMFDIFQVTNTSETEAVTVYLTLTPGEAPEENVGTKDNPEVLELVPNMMGIPSASAEKELPEGNEGYFYQVVAPANGKLTVFAGAMDAENTPIDWMYVVNNLTANKFGDTHWSDDDEPVYYEEIDVTAGDVIEICVATYNTDPMVFTNPEGKVYVNVGFAEAGTRDNPEAILPGDHTASVKENSDGYYYKFVAEEDGSVTVTINTLIANAFAAREVTIPGWMFTVNNLTAGKYGDTHWSDDDEVVTSETINVKAGDVVQIIINTYDPANEWNAPAGTVDWTLEFSNEFSFDGEGLLYTLSGAIVDDKLEVQLNLESNEEGISYAYLELPYNAEAIEFVSAAASNDVFTSVDVNEADGVITLLAEVDDEEGYPSISDANGAVITAVFNILDAEADAGFDLTVKDYIDVNHAVVDPMDYETLVPVKLTFRDMVNLKAEPKLEVTGEDVDGKLHVYVDIADNPGIWSLAFAVNYDKDVLELVDVIKGDVFTADDVLTHDNGVALNFFGNNEASVKENITANGTVVELVFNVLDYDADYGIEVIFDADNTINVDSENVELAVKYGEIEKVEARSVTVTIDGVSTEYEIGSTVTLDAPFMINVKDTNLYYVFKKWVAEGVELSDATAKETTFVVPANDVTITSNRFLHGDVDGNGKLDGVDFARLKQYLLDKYVPADLQVCNVNFDAKGTIDGIDFAILKQMLLGKFNYGQYEVSVVEEY